MTDLQDVDRQFLEACERGNLDEVLKILYYHDNGPTKLLERDPESLNHMHYFHATCFHGHHEVVEQLFVFGVDVNLKSNHGTPLSVASQAGHLETVKVLVEHNATIFDPDMPETLSPIFQASKNGHVDVFNYLISKKPEVIPVMGPHLLVQACHDGFLTIVIELLSKDVDVNGISASSSPSHAPISIDSLLESPLHAACSQNHTEVAAYLLQEGAEVTVDLVEHYHEELGEAVSRNFKKYTGRHWKEQGNLVEADFRAANYYSIHESWFTRFSDQLVSVDLSNNHIQNIPKDVMNLPSLREIDVSSNGLFDLPEVVDIVNSRLVTITATSNQLPCIPWSFFHIQSLQHLNLSKNKIRSLLNVQECHGYGVEEDTSEELVWTCSHLKSLNLSKNELTFIPLAIHGANSLEKLLLSDNKLATIPRGWKCPLRILHLARNDLEDFQESVFNTWIQTMEDLNLSSNKLTEISWDICQLQTLKYLDLSHNKIESLPPKSYWTCSNLRSLNLSNNKLCGVRQCLEGSGSTKPKRFSLARSPASEEHQLVEDEFPHEVFGGSLELLDLSNNELYAIPGSLCKLTSLEELNFTGNRNLRTLPPELGNLMECFQLRLEGLNLTGIPKYARPGRNVTSKDILAYLRAKQRKAVPYYRMKLMVVGLQGRGKTTLLASLRNKPLPPNISTVGIVVNEWTISGCQSFLEKMTKRGRKETPPKSNPTITFSTWDLAGQQVYYSTHQCFLSTNTLYLAVWNTTHGVEGIEKLKPWLLNVQARAPGSHIIIVGTHVDLLPEKTKAKRVDELRLKIGKKYNKKGYPIIKGNYVVSCTTGENIAVLRQAIYAAALELKELENAGRGESLIGRKIPLSYIKLQENVVKEAETRKREDKPPILNEEQMLELAKQDPNNDIFARDELVLAARFLHENGVILHFNDRSRGLDKLFFIEPGWLCEIMAVLVTVKETNAFVKGGIIERSNVDLLLRNPRLPSKFLEQYIQLMERFEVALTLNEHHLLVPSMLPRDKPGLRLHDLRKTLTKKNNRRSRSSNDDLSNEGTTDSESEYLKRLYKMNYVPSGFWSRLIARLMIAIQKWGVAEGLGDELISSEAGKTVRKTSNLRPVPHGYSMIYWREGMGVVYDRGHLMVESFRDKERNVYNGLFEDVEGVMVTVWSAEKDFSALGFVTDQINALISEWYPGLEEHDKHGIPLVRHVIPCPTCAQRAKSSTYGRCGSVSSRFQRALSVESLQRVDESKPQEFSLTECAAAAVSHTEISCPYHVDEPVKLASLVPDLILSDLPKELLIDGKFLTFNPVEENRLGAGGAGEVFLGTYKKQRVAIKRFYSTKESWAEVDSGIRSGLSFRGNRGGSRHTDGSYFSGRVFITRLTSLEEELHRTKILSSFWEIRQEVSVLGRLNHPCVVALIGVCVRPLCIVLELSPMGSLFSILETELAKREEARFQKDSQMSVDVRKTIFERDLTYKIVYQVAHALYYLHNLGIIYRDLKSDNLLVWTLGKDALVHVKLSDYGISRFATPQGVLGEEGTPGFQAPEVRTGSTYNEKVDIFSFAMLIYEVLSGFRPYYECRCSAQIKKALRRGERPSLERNSIDSEMPEMEAMMEKCWRESIASRPSAESILERMEDPSFLCLHRVLPYADQDSWTSITAFIPLSTEDQVFTVGGTRPSKGNYSVLLWGGENEERCYSVIDCQTGFYQVPQTLCLGCRVACLVRVGDRYWLGTEVTEEWTGHEGSAIEVFGRSAPGSDLKVLWSIKLRAQVLGLEVEQHVKYTSNDFPAPSIRRVFASLANGTVVVISRPEDRQNSSTICSLQFREGANDKLRQEASTFSVITTVEVGDRQCPACCMLFVNEGKELWVGCGNGVAVVDVETLEVRHNFRVYYSQRSNVRAMVTDGQTVFTINRQSTQVLQWHVETRRLLYRFDCNVDNPQDHVIAVKISSENEPADISSETTDPGDGDAFPSSKTSEEDEVENVLPSTQAPSGADSVSADPQILPEVPNISSQSSRFHRQPSLMRTLRKRGSRNSLRKKPRGGTESDVGSIPNTNAGGEMRSRTHVISNPRKRITSVLVVDGNLWLGRETGDVVVVDISCVGDEQEYGKVLGVLSTGNEPGHSKKEVHEMRKVGRDKVVCCGRIMRERKRCKERSNTAPTKYRSFISSTSPFKSLLPSRMHNQITNIVKNVEEEPSEKYQLSIWSRWNTEDFKQFYKYHEDLENAS